MEEKKIEFLGENDKATSTIEKFAFVVSEKDGKQVLTCEATIKHTLTFAKQKVFVRNVYKVEEYDFEEYLKRSLVKQPPLISFQGNAAKEFKAGGEGNSMREVIARHTGKTIIYGEKQRGPSVRKPPTVEEASAVLLKAENAAQLRALIEAARAAGMLPAE